MLPFDSPRWKSLTHAYGSAEDTPALLQSVRLNPEPQSRHDGEPWSSLWSSLCHQGDCYPASYAAVPHLVDIALTASDPVDMSFFLLPALIEVARTKESAPAIPSDLLEDYTQAILQLKDSVTRRSSEPWDQYTLIAALGALAVAKGHVRVAEAILNLDDHLIDRLIALDFD